MPKVNPNESHENYGESGISWATNKLKEIDKK